MTEILIGLGSIMSIDARGPFAMPRVVLRLGVIDEVVTLDAEFTVWTYLVAYPRTMGELIHHVQHFPGDGVAPVPRGAGEIQKIVGRLRQKGVVVGYDEDEPEDVFLAFEVRPVPFYAAVADVPGTGDLIEIGTAGSTVLALTRRQQALWSRCDDALSVAHVAAGRAMAAGLTPEQADVPAAFRDCIDLVRAGAAYLDAVT